VASARATVIIPTFDAERSLARTLTSLTAFPETELAEVIVCDDGSADDTEGTALSFAGELPLQYLRQEHRGFRAAAARNLGIRRATSDIVILVDSDVVLPAGFLRAHIRRHRGAPSDRLVFGYRRRVRVAPHPNTRLACVADYEADHREARFGPKGREFEASPTPWYFAYSCNLSLSGHIRRQLFDENFVGWGNEDLEYAYRAMAGGARIVCAPEASLWHVDEGRTRDPFRCDSGEANFDSFIVNTVRMQRKHASDPVLWAHLEGDLVGYRIDGSRCVADPSQTDPRPIREWATKRLESTSIGGAGRATGVDG